MKQSVTIYERLNKLSIVKTTIKNVLLLAPMTTTAQQMMHIHMAERGKTDEQLLGAEGQGIMQNLFLKMLKLEEFNGEMRPDLAVTSN